MMINMIIRPKTGGIIYFFGQGAYAFPVSYKFSGHRPKRGAIERTGKNAKRAVRKMNPAPPKFY